MEITYIDNNKKAEDYTKKYEKEICPSCCIYYLQERVYDENGEYGIVGLTWVAEEEIE